MNKKRPPTNVKSQIFQNYFDNQKHEKNDQSPNLIEDCFKGCYFLELEGGKLFTHDYEKRDNHLLKDMSKEFFLLELDGGKELEK
ncbi:MAG: hypothetical protein ACYC56_08430 [Candidatus Aquicultor sp.]